MLVSWALRIAKIPKTDLDFWKALFPVVVAHTIGHVAATISMSMVAFSFTHIIKSAEPAFSVLVSRFLLGESFPTSVYLSLLLIIGGCGLAALTELNFNMIDKDILMAMPYHENDADITALTEFYTRYVTSAQVGFVVNGAETSSYLRDMYSLFIVGKGGRRNSPLTTGMSDWKDCP